jgi:hypothetical protein
VTQPRRPAPSARWPASGRRADAATRVGKGDRVGWDERPEVRCTDAVSVARVGGSKVEADAGGMGRVRATIPSRVRTSAPGWLGCESRCA